MADVKPLKLVDQGGGAARLSEFEAGDTLPKAVMAALSAADVGAVAADDPRLSDAREWSAETVAQAEAEAGTATTRRAWTAQRVRQAIVAWWNGISSPFGRGLVAAVSPLMGRQHLELGNAATATVQSSNTDSTAGRVLTVGAFGLGTDGAQGRTRPTDCNAATVSGFYAVGGTTLNRPPAAGSSAGLLEVYAWESSATIKFQRFLLINTGNAVSRTFTRFTDVSGVWGDWAEVFTQRSILGTVSQSAGVPTGAIIERGSNANGRFTKYADGTVVMDKSGDAITTNPVTTVGAVTSVDSNKLRYGFWY